MPSLVSCERSPPASPVVESPPRKKFKFSLKLKSKTKKGNVKVAKDEVSSCKTDKKNEEIEPKDQKSTIEDSTGNESNDTLLAEAVTPPLPFAGLANLGNTCYLNAVLQVLRYCPKFLQSMANLDELYTQESTEARCDEDNDVSSENQVTPTIIHSIHKLACEMSNAEENYNKNGMDIEEVKNRSGYTTLAVQPSSFVKDFSNFRPMFGNYQQHDAQEFLRSFLSLIEDDCTGLTKDNNNDKNNMKEIPVNLNESKVRGGCKYPNGAYTQSVAEPTSMKMTHDNTRTEGIEDSSNDKSYLINKPITSKSLQQNACSKCSADSHLNMVQRLFEGTLQLQTRCLNCELVRRRYEAFQDISVPVQNSPNIQSDEVVSLSDSEDAKEEDLNLTWAISKFASIERLEGDNKYYCDYCNTLTEADIITYFENLPQVLTIHLKRFQTSYGQSLFTSNLVTKVTKSLHTPQHLSLKKWCSTTCADETATYQLFGVVMHSGMSSCSGHYISYVNIDIMNMEQGEQLSECKCKEDEVPACSVEENNKNTDKRVECMKANKDSCLQDIDINMEQEAQLNDCKCKKDVPVCSCSVEEKDKRVEGRKRDEDSCHENGLVAEPPEDEGSCLQDEAVEESPPRGITKYFKPIRRKQKDAVKVSEVSQNLPCRVECMEENKDSCLQDIDMKNMEQETQNHGCKCKKDAVPACSCSVEENNKGKIIECMKKDEDSCHEDKSVEESPDIECLKNDEDNCHEGESVEKPRLITEYFKPIWRKRKDAVKAASKDSQNLSCQPSPTTHNISCKPPSSPNRTIEESNDPHSISCKPSPKDSVDESSKNISCDESPCQNNDSLSVDKVVSSHKCPLHSTTNTQSEQCMKTDNIIDYNDMCTNDTSSKTCTNETISEICTNETISEMCTNETISEICTNDASSKPSRGKWLKFDDAEVQEINDTDMDEVLSPSTSCYSTPYLLFYFRV